MRFSTDQNVIVLVFSTFMVFCVVVVVVPSHHRVDALHLPTRTRLHIAPPKRVSSSRLFLSDGRPPFPPPPPPGGNRPSPGGNGNYSGMNGSDQNFGEKRKDIMSNRSANAAAGGGGAGGGGGGFPPGGGGGNPFGNRPPGSANNNPNNNPSPPNNFGAPTSPGMNRGGGSPGIGGGNGPSNFGAPGINKGPGASSGGGGPQTGFGGGSPGFNGGPPRPSGPGGSRPGSPGGIGNPGPGSSTASPSNFGVPGMNRGSGGSTSGSGTRSFGNPGTASGPGSDRMNGDQSRKQNNFGSPGSSSSAGSIGGGGGGSSSFGSTGRESGPGSMTGDRNRSPSSGFGSTNDMNRHGDNANNFGVPGGMNGDRNRTPNIGFGSTSDINRRGGDRAVSNRGNDEFGRPSGVNGDVGRSRNSDNFGSPSGINGDSSMNGRDRERGSTDFARPSGMNGDTGRSRNSDHFGRPSGVVNGDRRLDDRDRERGSGDFRSRTSMGMNDRGFDDQHGRGGGFGGDRNREMDRGRSMNDEVVNDGRDDRYGREVERGDRFNDRNRMDDLRGGTFNDRDILDGRKGGSQTDDSRNPSFSFSSRSTSASSTHSSSSYSSNPSSLVLFGHPESRSPLVQWAAYELDLGDLRIGNLAENPHPFGKIPCLLDESILDSGGGNSRNSRRYRDDNAFDEDDEIICIFESGAILQYLHDQFYASPLGGNDSSSSGGNHRRSPLSPKLSAALASWIVWANASLEPLCFVTNPIDGSTIEGTGLQQRKKSGRPIVEMDRLDDYLFRQLSMKDRDVNGEMRGEDNNQYLLGRGSRFFTVADIAVASYLLFALRFYPDTDLSPWPHVVRFLVACARRPAYGRAFGREVQDKILGTLRNTNVRGIDGNILRLPSSSKKRGRLPSTLTLYGLPSSPQTPLIEWAIYELGLNDYLRDGDLRSNPNPLGKVPTMTAENGKIMVFEVGGIMQYLQDTYGMRIDGGKINEDEDMAAQDSAEINSWIVFANTDLEPFTYRATGQEGLRSGGKPDGPMKLGESTMQSGFMTPQQSQRNQQPRLVRAGEMEHRRFQIVEKLEGLGRLNDLLMQKQGNEERNHHNEPSRSRRPCYIVGNEFSLADVAVASYLLFLPQNYPGLDLAQWPALLEYMTDCAERSGYGFAFGRQVQAYVLSELEASRHRPASQRSRDGPVDGRNPSGDIVGGPRGRGLLPDGGRQPGDKQRPGEDGRKKGLFRPAI